jgi:hypothetical protein
MDAIERFGTLLTGAALGLAVGILIGQTFDTNGLFNFLGAFGGAGVTVLGTHWLEARKRAADNVAKAKALLAVVAKADDAASQIRAFVYLDVDGGYSRTMVEEAVAEIPRAMNSAAASISGLCQAFPATIPVMADLEKSLLWLHRIAGDGLRLSGDEINGDALPRECWPDLDKTATWALNNCATIRRVLSKAI